MESESEVVESCPTLSDPMGWRLLGSSVHGIFQARVLEWGAIAFSVHIAHKKIRFPLKEGGTLSIKINPEVLRMQDELTNNHKHGN